MIRTYKDEIFPFISILLDLTKFANFLEVGQSILMTLKIDLATF